MNNNEVSVDFSLVIPAYNEEYVIEESISESVRYLEALDYQHELVVCDNASTDSTAEIVQQIANTRDDVRYTYEEEAGRGNAVTTGFREAEGDVLAFIDADLSTDMAYFSELIESIIIHEFDVATGSRWVPGREAKRPLKRSVVSRGFNFLVRTMLNSELYDHQCGFKAFRRDVFEDLINQTEAEHWFWDTELLVLAQNHGFRVREFPVDWEPKGGSSVDLKSDIPTMASQLLKLAIRLRF